jgi:hypothetical protein
MEAVDCRRSEYRWPLLSLFCTVVPFPLLSRWWNGERALLGFRSVPLFARRNSQGKTTRRGVRVVRPTRPAGPGVCLAGRIGSSGTGRRPGPGTGTLRGRQFAPGFGQGWVRDYPADKCWRGGNRCSCYGWYNGVTQMNVRTNCPFKPCFAMPVPTSRTPGPDAFACQNRRSAPILGRDPAAPGKVKFNVLKILSYRDFIGAAEVVKG